MRGPRAGGRHGTTAGAFGRWVVAAPLRGRGAGASASGGSVAGNVEAREARAPRSRRRPVPRPFEAPSIAAPSPRTAPPKRASPTTARAIQSIGAPPGAGAGHFSQSVPPERISRSFARVMAT